VSAVPAEAARDQSFVSVATAFAANATIAAAKGIAAALTGSPALLAETLHTLADTGNEVLLFVALRRSRRVPDATHPLGYGPERYYWALLAAVGMFVIGGTLSIWEGVNALINPLPLEAFWVGVAVLVIALTLDSVSRAVALRQLRAQAAQRGVTVRELLRESPDPTVVTVYLEDSIDVLGAALALVALVLHRTTGSAVYLGPGEVLVAADVRMAPDMTGGDITAVLESIRDDAARELPVIARLYLTPVPADRSPRAGDQA
jgi:cation diffusion facilitator family transporter